MQRSPPRVLPWLLAGAALPRAHLEAPVTYVKASASGANNGTSWTDAYTDLQAALTATASGELWVAAGTYRPAPPGGSQLATFTLRRGLALFGGFAGEETIRQARRPSANATILSGDLNGDDGANWIR